MNNLSDNVMFVGDFNSKLESFTSFIQLGYIPTARKIATLRMLLKPDKLPSLTTRYRPVSLITSIKKLFEKIIEQRLHSQLEQTGFINISQVSEELSLPMTTYLGYPNPSCKVSKEENM